MYKVISPTHIQKMPDGPTILRGDSGQWKQNQVLQDDEVEIEEQVLIFDKWFLFTNGWHQRDLPRRTVALSAIPKPKPIETLFKEAMEKAEEQFYGGKSPESRNYKSTWSHGAEWAFNYLLTNKMIK